MESKEGKMRIEFNREETEALMDCVAVADKSKDCGILMMPTVAKFRLNKVNLDDLWVRIFKAHERKYMQIPQRNTINSAGS